jgi:hypothetical protein
MADFVLRTQIDGPKLKVKARRADGAMQSFTVPLVHLKGAKFMSREVGRIVDFLMGEKTDVFGR